MYFTLPHNTVFYEGDVVSIDKEGVGVKWKYKYDQKLFANITTIPNHTLCVLRNTYCIAPNFCS